VKWIGKRGAWKRIINEIRIDIQSYHAHPYCQTIVFVIVDTLRDIPDPRLMEKELSGSQTILGKTIDIRAYVVEP